MIKLFTIFLLAITTSSSWAQMRQSDSPKIMPDEVRAIDKVVVIKAISTSGRTFLIKEGFKSGIGVGMSALFSNKHVTTSARAIEVSSESSMWEVRDARSVAPFDKNDIVVFTNSLERRPFEVPELHRLEERLARMDSQRSEGVDTFAVRASLSRAMNESTSDAASEASPTRQGFQLELMYMRLFAKRWEYSLGVRFDQEVATLKSPALDVPTTRLMGTFDLLYHFHNEPTRPHYYAGLGIGFGRSQTDVDGIKSSGSSYALPIARLGRTFDWHQKMIFFGEFAFESIAMIEKIDEGEEQTTTIVNAKFTLGIRF